MTFRISQLSILSIALIAAGARAQTGSTSNPAAAGMPQWKILHSIQDFGGLKRYAEEDAALPAHRQIGLSSWGIPSPSFGVRGPHFSRASHT
jgi:hypothetical protein